MNSKYWQPELETMPRKELEALQVKKLRQSIEVALKSPFYKKRLGDLGITPDSIQTVADIRKIPFTTKQDLRDNYPFGLVGGDMKDAIRIHSTSGTTGHPTVVTYSRHDIDSWANMIARDMYMVGCRDTDVFQNSSGYGMFTGGLGFQYGAEKLGATTVPAAAGNSKRQIMFIKDFGTTCLHAIPSYAIRLAEVFQEEGVDPRSTKLRTLFIGAEPHTEEQRRRIERLLDVKAYNSFGMTEMNGPGVAFECLEQNGMHLWEDNYILEIVDPDTLEPVPDGEIGEMILNDGKAPNDSLQLVSSEWLKEMTASHQKLGKNYGYMSYGYLWWKPHDGRDVVAAIGDGGNVIYVDKERSIAVGVTGTFKPRIFDRVDFIEKKVLNGGIIKL